MRVCTGIRDKRLLESNTAAYIHSSLFTATDLFFFFLQQFGERTHLPELNEYDNDEKFAKNNKFNETIATQSKSKM